MQVITTEARPIKSWCPDIEEGALQQARNLANLPFIHKHVVLCSDAHQGFGMPIGGVIATKGVIIPYAVGYDIGCLDKDTEFLSINGWKKITDWDNEYVLQYNKYADVASFVIPQRYIVKNYDSFHHFKTKYGLDQMLTIDHKMLVWQGCKGRGYNLRNYTANDFISHHETLTKGIQGGIKTTFGYNTTNSLNLSDNEIRLFVLVSADGCIRDKNNGRVELHFRKNRKIKRSIELLNKCNIKYNVTVCKDGSTLIYFKMDGITKDLSIFWGASEHQLNIVASECLLWDGHKGLHEFYSTTNKEFADIVQFAFAVSGIRTGIHKINTTKNKWKDCYIVYKTNNEIVGFSKNCVSKVPSIDGKAYCFTVPTGYFVIRRNNKVSITGNCGMVSVKTSLTEIDQQTIKRIMGGSKEFKGGVRAKIPIGFKHHSKRQDESLMPEGIGLDPEVGVYGKPDLLVCMEEYRSALKQIGTLGSNNHFIEFQKGDDGHIWVMIHSGSRNLGWKVADYYNKLAIELNEKWHTKVPKKWQLAFLPLDSKEGQMYFAEMNYCIGFAFANRKLMMDRTKECILEVLPDTKFDEMINIHHNYAAKENHYGKNVIVHRKGATLARKGTIGIIPGSQGSSSYIVEGLGNPESFMSCSHGAGRKMSRTRAKNELDPAAEIKRMDDMGIVHGMRHQNYLDEATGAYKDINLVIQQQLDLIKVLVKLKPLAVIKG